MAGGAVYWIGQDGNIWYKDSGGTRNMGPAGANVTQASPTGFNDPWADNLQEAIHFDAQQIDDPAVQRTTTTAPVSTTLAAPKPVLNQAAVNNTQLAIDQIGSLLQAALANEDQGYINTNAQYDANEGQQRGTYDKSTVTNQKNYDSNYMDSIRAGIKGLGGLMALLRGTGAAGGTADDLVRDTVGGVTSNDIRAGADTRDENQGALDSSLSTFLTELKGKRQLASDTHANNMRAIQRDSDTQLQDLYSKMAGFYGDAEMTPQRDMYMTTAGSLTPRIASNSKAVTSPYDTTPVAIQAPALSAFAGPTQPNVLAAPQDGQVGSGIFTMSRKKTPELTRV